MTSNKLPISLCFAPIAIIWALFFVQASFFWGSEGYYFFGWLVPPITAYLIWYKISTLPKVETRLNPVLASLAGAMACLFALIYGMYETMPFWRPLLFLMGAVASAFSFLYVAALGGKIWARHFLTVFFISLICLPWPSSWESDIVFKLTMAVTKATEFSLNLLGYAANSVGNRIDVQGQHVEVGDACSGVRSFQGLFMVGVVVGELYRFRWRRVILMLAAFAISFPLNIFRALTLSLIVVSGGTDAYDRWHDPLGGIVYAVGCAAILGFGMLIQSKKDEEELPLRYTKATRRPSLWLPLTITGCRAFYALALEFHFASGYKDNKAARIWSISPEQADDTLKQRRLPIAPEVYETLLYDDANYFELYSEYGDRFEFYDFTYEGGMMGVLAAEHHTPEVCMGGYGGGVLREKKTDKTFTLGDTQIPTFGFTFEFPGGFDLHAFQGVWIAGTEGTPRSRYEDLIFATGTQRLERLEVSFRRLLAGKRDYVVQVFLIVLPGEMSLEEAWRRSETILRNTLQQDAKTLDLALN